MWRESQQAASDFAKVVVVSHMPRATDLTSDEQIGLLSGVDFWHTRPLPVHDLPPATLSDGPLGIRLQRESADHLGVGDSHPATCFPSAVTLASSWDLDLAREVAVALGAEASQLGVDVVLGPGLNIKRNPLGGRNFEYFSEDPFISGRFAAAVVDGLQSVGVGACLKHYAVNNQEYYRFVVDVVVDERTLREIYLSGFEYAVKRGKPWTVMASYNSVDGELASQNRRLLTQILRDEWGFDGVVMSDWGAVYERDVGITAGMDLEMPGGHSLSDNDIQDALASGQLTDRQVETSAQRVLDLLARVQGNEVGSVEPDHDELCRRAAAAGTVLLRNDDTLPLDRRASIALIGGLAEVPRFQGAGSSLVNPTRVTTVRDAFADAGVEVTYAEGYDPVTSTSSAAQLDDAARIAASADVAAVMVGLPPAYESEGFDRDTLSPPAAHDELVSAVAQANPRTVVVLSNGAPVTMPWRDEVAAIVEGYLGGQASGAAVVDVLLGDAEPGGRLAETFPERLEDVASTPWFPGRPRQVEYREGLFVGYRHHVSGGPAPAFPFGHGLGYTTFDWSDPQLSSPSIRRGQALTVSITVTNTGTRAGSEVVQIYRRDLTGVVLRPERELAGFAKVHLEVGGSRRVDVEVPARSFEFWDVRTDEWRCPTGRFELVAARSSADHGLTLSLQVDGDATDSADPPSGPALTASDVDFAARLGRSIPAPRPTRPFDRDSTFAEIATTPAGRAFRAICWRATIAGTELSDADRPMVERNFAELPLRAAARFGDGKLSWRTIDLVLRLCNLGRR